MTDHQVASREEWQAAREELLKREKEHTRTADVLARQRRELPWVAIDKEYRPGPDEDGLPPVVAQNAAAAGTDIPGYLSESPAVTVFTLTSGAVYQTYATTWRGVEFLMNYYPILDRVPKGRDEGGAWQTWLRRHDEYDRQ